MVYPKDYRQLRNYTGILQKTNIAFDCPNCSLRMSPKDFERHCQEQHHIDTRLSCVWCFGKFSWPNGCKFEHADHLRTCFRDFMTRYHLSYATTAASSTTSTSTPILDSAPTVTDLSKYTRYDLTSQCEPKQLFGRTRLRNLSSRAYRLIHSTPLSPDSLYEHDGLNLAIECIRLFNQTQGRSVWYHLMVRAVAFHSFLQAMDEQLGKCTLLPFSCWCDGGIHWKAKHRQHRHMIVIAPSEKHFKSQVYNRIVTSRLESPGKRFRSKDSRSIKDAYHLIHTMGYLSRRESNCQFTHEDMLQTVSEAHQQHYYIFTPLPVDYKKMLFLQWPEGLKTVFRKECFRNVSIPQMVDQPLVRMGGRYVQKVKHFYRLEQHKVLPVQKRFAPTTRETPHFVFLYNGTPLFFEASTENEQLDELAWIQKQVEGGNCFYEGAVGEQMWAPNCTQQSVLNYYVPVVKRNTTLEQENADLRLRLEQAGEVLKRAEEAREQAEDALKRAEEARKRAEDERKKSEDEDKIKLNQIITLHQEMDRLKSEEIIRLKERIITLENEATEMRERIISLENELELLR